MVRPEAESSVTAYLLRNLTPKDRKLEVGRLIFDDKFGPAHQIQYWAFRQGLRQTTEKVLELDQFPDLEVSITFAPPSYVTDIFEGEDVPFWQISNVKRVLSSCRIIYDPQDFIKTYIGKVETLQWSPEVIALKENVALELVAKSQRFLDQDMLADAYAWAIKAAEEAICAQLMRSNLFNVTTPSLLLDTLRQKPPLLRFYLDLIGADLLSPDLVVVALKELENLATQLFYANEGTDREQWILTGFVSINEAERKIMHVLEQAQSEEGVLDLVEWQAQYEDAVAELWQAFFLVAQTPWRWAVPLDPWVVGLFWKWHVTENPPYDVETILTQCRSLVNHGTLT